MHQSIPHEGIDYPFCPLVRFSHIAPKGASKMLRATANGPCAHGKGIDDARETGDHNIA